MAKGKLTNKQESFVLGLIEGKSQRQSYKDSYNAKKMKDTTIDRKAHELLQDGKVSARFQELQEKVRAKAEQGSVASGVEVLEYLSRVMRKDEIEYSYDMFGNEHKNKVRTKDSTKAAELLGKYYNLFSGKEENTRITINFVGEDEIEK